MSFKDQLRKDFETVFLNTDEFAETFDVVRNGSISHQLAGVFKNKTVLEVKLDADILTGDILRSRDTSRHLTVQNISKTASCLTIYCQ